VINYFFKKVLLLVPILLGITLITFTLTKALPGDPVLSMVGERARPEVIKKIRQELGQDRSSLMQYVGYISLLGRGEFGRSYYTNKKVFEDLLVKFPNTLKLAMAAMLVAIPIGISFGFIAACNKNLPVDRILSSLSVMGLSVPVFWSGILIMLLFSLKLKLFPPSGTGDIRFLVLPAFTLSLPAIATLSRITRTTVLDVLDMPFFHTARAKGITEWRIYTVHVMKNVLVPLITVIGLDFGSYLNGAVLTETIFGWDGIGRFAMEGIMKRDYPVIMGCVIAGTAVFVMVNVFVDIMYHFIDPRIRIHGKTR